MSAATKGRKAAIPAAKPTAKAKQKVAVSGLSGSKFRRAALARQIKAEAASRTADGGETFAPSHWVKIGRAAAVEIGCRNADGGNGGLFALYYR